MAIKRATYGRAYGGKKFFFLKKIKIACTSL